MKSFQIFLYSIILLINCLGCTAIKDRLPKKQIQTQDQSQTKEGQQVEPKRKVDPIPINPQHS